MTLDLDGVLRRRLAAQHLVGDPLTSVADAVGHSLAVQSQDMPLARFSLGLRTGLTDADVLAQLATGEVVRTHVLRPTWHWVLATDLRWLLALTGPKTVSGVASRHRTLGIDPATQETALGVLGRELAGRHLTRNELKPLLPTTANPRHNEVVTHLLLVAESLGLVCSGTPRADGEHTYALVDEVVPPGPELDRDEAVQRLVDRFVAGHGPTSVKDLMRWAKLTKTEATRALADGDFETATLDGVQLWFTPASPRPSGSRATRSRAFPADSPRSWLLPTFDEVFLSHDRPRFPRPEGHPWDTQHLSPAEAGGGVVVVDGRDVGVFKRRLQRGGLTVEIWLASDAHRGDEAGARHAAERLGVHLGMPPEVTVHSARP